MFKSTETRRKNIWRLGLVGTSLAILMLRAQTLDPALHPIQDIPGLQRVLLIGDSISQGYTPEGYQALAKPVAASIQEQFGL